MLDALTPDAMPRTIDWGPFGVIALPEFLEIQVNDLLVHAWDLGQPLGLDRELMRWSWDWVRERPELPPGPIGLGPALEPPAGADEQDRYLAYLGRAA
ncbi:hypothetical protein [Saccharothrix sp.]|uniref:hypothetical protein n=1 Tax=Saccharothrix sp. TaxID=1873460 RepID=UPI002811E44A|nr:hypothetical protein [Saccharothrix sp.]